MLKAIDFPASSHLCGTWEQWWGSESSCLAVIYPPVCSPWRVLSWTGERGGVRGSKARQGRIGRREINCLLDWRFMTDRRVALLHFHSVGIYLEHVVSIWGNQLGSLWNVPREEKPPPSRVISSAECENAIWEHLHSIYAFWVLPISFRGIKPCFEKMLPDFSCFTVICKRVCCFKLVYLVHNDLSRPNIVNLWSFIMKRILLFSCYL